ncbi:MAG: phosphoserine phosphatase RsbU/P [Mucilaginibacter sp.]|nr:phosphoserine phosphatase RsbU/P [Mucilaginibacter sp.]
MPANEQLILENEPERLAAVRRYDVLDTPPDGAFDRVTRLAARQFDVPISIVSIVDTDRIWFKSHHGVDVDEIGRDPGLCASAILADETWVVENAQTDPRAMANPLVAGELGLRFYAGAPLTTHDGYNLGTLCVIDSQPREFSDQQAAMLRELAGVVMDELELRLQARRTVSHELLLREQAERTARELQASLLPSDLPEIAGAERATLYVPADRAVVGGDFYDMFIVDDACIMAVGDVSGKDAAAAASTGLARHSIRSSSQWAGGPMECLRNLNHTMLLDAHGDDITTFCTVVLVFARRSEYGFTLRIASAGHPPALLCDAAGRCTELTVAGPPAGWYEEAAFEEIEVDLRSGQTIVMYTDGLPEARSAGTLVGIERVIEALTRVAGSAEDAIAALRGVVTAADVNVGDDVAALAFGAL